MKKFFQEFKNFAVKGNVVDMAIGIIIGGAFGKIVTSFVTDIIMPPIGLLVGGVNFSDLAINLKDAYIDAAGVEHVAVTLNYGNFIQVLLDFLIIAFTIFLVIRGINKLRSLSETKKQDDNQQPDAPVITKEEQLLTEIRDLLKEKKA